MMILLFSILYLFILKFKINNMMIYSNYIYFLSFMYLFNFNNFNNYMKINEMFGINMYSFMLLILSLWIISVIFMFFKLTLKDIEYYKFLMLMLLLILIFVFLSMNLLIFYFMFESSLILMFLMIMKWGMGEMRKLASFYLLYYTMFFSMPFMILIFVIFNYYDLTMIYFMEMMSINFFNIWMLFYFMFTFFIKIPMYLLHSWLLKAHVEAPVIGSMILAAILLKLGVYGLIRFMMIFKNDFIKFNMFILYISILGSLIVSILCLRQVDMKILVAYSSVVHMGLMLSSLMTFLNFSIKGSYMMMIAHGLCSSGLFFLVNLMYLKSNSRLMLMNKGLMNIYPSMSLMWFLLCSSNLSAPMSLNLVSEIMLMISLLNWNFLIMLILMFLMFFSFLYSLNLFSFTQHGEFEFNFQNLMNFKLMDYLVLLIHWLPLNLFIFNLMIFI